LPDAIHDCRAPHPSRDAMREGVEPIMARIDGELVRAV